MNLPSLIYTNLRVVLLRSLDPREPSATERILDRAHGMYEVAVQGSFCATHQVALPDGAMEPLHGHDWRVTALWGGRQLDERGMIVDFDEARRSLTGLLAELDHTSLNEHPWFGGVSASAERVARIIFERLESAVGSAGEALVSVTVSEAPNCSATYRRD